jgi:hypothetical protein
MLSFAVSPFLGGSRFFLMWDFNFGNETVLVVGLFLLANPQAFCVHFSSSRLEKLVDSTVLRDFLMTLCVFV